MAKWRSTTVILAEVIQEKCLGKKYESGSKRSGAETWRLNDKKYRELVRLFDADSALISR